MPHARSSREARKRSAEIGAGHGSERLFDFDGSGWLIRPHHEDNSLHAARWLTTIVLADAHHRVIIAIEDGMCLRDQVQGCLVSPFRQSSVSERKNHPPILGSDDATL
jgi:hypothetical protein